jgi:hypothetical protein
VLVLGVLPTQDNTAGCYAIFRGVVDNAPVGVLCGSAGHTVLGADHWGMRIPPRVGPESLIVLGPHPWEMLCVAGCGDWGAGRGGVTPLVERVSSSLAAERGDGNAAALPVVSVVDNDFVVEDFGVDHVVGGR